MYPKARRYPWESYLEATKREPSAQGQRNLFYVIVLPLGHFSVDIPGGAMWLLAPAIGLAWDLSPAEIGFLITASTFGAGLGYLPSGILGDKFRHRGMMLTLTVWWVVIGYLAASAASGYWTLTLMLVAASIGDGAWHPMATGTMVQRMPQRRALALGVHLTGGILAEVVGPLAAGFLLGYLDWEVVFRISIIPALLMGVGLLYLHRFIAAPREAPITRSDLGAVLSVWRSWAGFLMFGLGVTYSMAFVGLMAMTALFFQDYHGYSSAWAGTAFAAMLLGGAIAAPLMGRLSDSMSRKRVVVLSSFIGAGGILLTAASTHPVPLVLGVVIAGTVLTGMRPVYLAAAVEMVGRRETTALGMIYAVMDGIGSLGGLLAGLAGTNDLRYAFVFAAGASVLSGLFALAHPFATHEEVRQNRS